MNNIEMNKHMMYVSVLCILDSFQPVISKIALLNDTYLEYKNLIQELKDEDNTYLNVKKGTASDKKVAREKMTEELIAKAGILFVYAGNNDNGNLKAISNINHSGLQLMRETELLQKANNILTHYKAHLDELVKIGVAPESANELEEKITAYENAITTKEMKHVQGKSARKDLKNLFKEIDDILKNKLDKLIEMAKFKDINCYNQYKTARIIKDFGQSGSSKQENPTS